MTAKLAEINAPPETEKVCHPVCPLPISRDGLPVRPACPALGIAGLPVPLEPLLLLWSQESFAPLPPRFATRHLGHLAQEATRNMGPLPEGGSAPALAASRHVTCPDTFRVATRYLPRHLSCREKFLARARGYRLVAGQVILEKLLKPLRGRTLDLLQGSCLSSTLSLCR